jgi:hypothetical protein
MAQCEPDACSIWSFAGKQGVGRWDTGPVANLIIEHFDEKTVAVRREDVTGPGQGIRGLYVGTRNGNHIDGTFTWSWPGHGQLSTGTVNWVGIVASDAGRPEPIVPSMAVCEDGPDQCANWSFVGREGHARWLNNAFSELSVVNFGSQEVFIRRMDKTGTAPALMAVYVGKRQGNHIEGSVIWSWPGHPQAVGTTKWRADIGASAIPTPMDKGIAGKVTANAPTSAPRPDAAGDSPAQRQIAAENKRNFREDGCPKELPDGKSLSSFEMWQKGRTIDLETSDLNTNLEAMKWFCKAAEAGSGQAAFELGELYYEGVVLPSLHLNGVIYSNFMQADMTKALDWYNKAANLGNTSGMVAAATFYRAGSAIKGNTVPIDVKRAMKLATAAADAGDTEAMVGLILIYRQGMEDSSGKVIPDSGLAARMEGKLAASMLKVQADCLSVAETIVEETPERRINRLYGGGSHDHSFFCVAALEPEESDGSLVGSIRSALQGAMMQTWRYTIYLTDNPSQKWVTRASVREEFTRAATDAALVTAAINKK